MKEIWKDIPGYKDSYQASSLGRIRSLDRYSIHYSRKGKPYKLFHKGRTLKFTLNNMGYWSVCLYKKGKHKVHCPHYFVLLAFKGPRPKGKEGAHNNGISTDNRISNLRYDTKSNNQKDRVKHNTDMRGQKHPKSKLTDEKVRRARKESKKVSILSLVKKYNVSYATLHSAIRGRSWGHVK